MTTWLARLDAVSGPPPSKPETWSWPGELEQPHASTAARAARPAPRRPKNRSLR